MYNFTTTLTSKNWVRIFKIAWESLTGKHSTCFLLVYLATSRDSSVLNSSFEILKFCITSITESVVDPGVAVKPIILITLFSSCKRFKTYIGKVQQLIWAEIIYYKLLKDKTWT